MDNPKPPGAASELLSPEAMHWQADCEMADALSAFQSQVEPAAELTLQAVVEAAKPAFRLGFSFSVRSNEEGTTVLLRHRSGSQQSAEGEGRDDDFTFCARLLAGLLGIPVAEAPRPSKAEEQSCAEESAPPSGATTTVAPAGESTSATPSASGGTPTSSIALNGSWLPVAAAARLVQRRRSDGQPVQFRPAAGRLRPPSAPAARRGRYRSLPAQQGAQ
jgi:hypothetical protein